MKKFTRSKIRIVTAASLFDGHDAAINIMRRIMQAQGAEVIHLGHNRSAREIVEAAIQEDAQAIAVTSYQGGHMEFFKYMYDLLQENQCGHIKIFGGGGGTILPNEIEELHQYGIARIYSPDDGRRMGLEGMIADVLSKASPGDDFAESILEGIQYIKPKPEYWKSISLAITMAEEGFFNLIEKYLPPTANNTPVLGITGTGGAGKSSVTDEIVRRFLYHFREKSVAVLSVDPSRKKTGGALLGDRIRMNAVFNPRAYMRSMATRESNKSLSPQIQQAINICKAAGYDLVILESAGVGQSDASILDFCDVSLYVMTPEYGAATQLEKINMLDYADLVAINKFDKSGALDAYQDVCKQYKRNHGLFNAKNEDLPIVGTIASKFNNEGVNRLFELLVKKIKEKKKMNWGELLPSPKGTDLSAPIIPSDRIRYLAEIAETIEQYNKWATEQSEIASRLYQLDGAIKLLKNIDE
ncbi:MAG: cobalamin-dependent protein [Chitinophagales bacterium]|nr:cobalamin-dependent protein [Chitinophagales bacterium]MDW8273821.1 cobalamin-dependent protein [Chitinophagales bacterium]